ncbi:MAG: hypothetical protein KJO54_13890 [Gammaproteobacteria bacterium]|nr:hypothetical protein [Gammaproteobacteria bacterium]NNF60115.1 hypothetical protein [Gammaproteobacteria bacterium]NNM21527.1 hypothetical protein [Gammaproteobacteria bacterium]
MSRFYDLDRVGAPGARKVDRLAHYRTMQERFALEQGLNVARRRLVALNRRQAPWGWLAL